MNEIDERKGFDELITDYRLWLIYSERLEAAIKVLEKEDHASETYRTGNFNNGKQYHTPVLLMLKGMSIECLLKGLLVMQKKITSGNGEIQIGKYSQHSLNVMAADVENLQFTDDEEEILERIGYYIVAGRLPRKNLNTGKFKGFWSPDEEGTYQTILKKVKDLYPPGVPYDLFKERDEKHNPNP